MQNLNCLTLKINELLWRKGVENTPSALHQPKKPCVNSGKWFKWITATIVIVKVRLLGQTWMIELDLLLRVDSYALEN